MRRPEQALQRTIVHALRVALPRNWMTIHYAAGGYRKPVEAAILKSIGAVSGFPDLMILGELDSYPTAWFFEVKADKGRVSLGQEACHEQLRDLGFQVAVVRSLDEVWTACRQWRLPLRLSGLGENNLPTARDVRASYREVT